MHFTDACGKSWKIADLDPFVIEEVRSAAKVDLADVGGEVLTTLERDPVVLAKVLAVLCGPCDDKELAKGLRKDGIERAFEAVRGAVEDFFPPKRWSELQSNLKSRRDADAVFEKLKPLMDMLTGPGVPQAMREAVMAAVTDEIHGSIASSRSTVASPSASGQDVNPLSAASDSPALSG